MMVSFVARGKQIEVDQLENLLVVRTAAEEAAARVVRGECLVAWQGQLFGAGPVDGLPTEVVHFLSGSSWIPVAVVQGKDALPAVEPLAVGRLYRDADGNWMIGTGSITVRLKEELAQPAVDKALSRYGLSVKRQLKFAPNLYEAEAATPDQALKVAQAASHDEQFVYAEPTMLRQLSHR